MRRFAYLSTALLVACTDPSPDGVSGEDRGGKDDGPNVGGRLELSDVSILFPLPTTEAARVEALWLSPRTGERGPYFPWHLVDELPPLNADLPSALGYPAAMITSVRFDPCAQTERGGACEVQLRLVAQPVFPFDGGVTMLDDAAVHLFYRLDAAGAAAVIAALGAARDVSPVSTAGPLRVHPGLGRADSGPLAAALGDLVVAHCREDNLIRITTNSFAFDNWGFIRHDLLDGQLVRVELPGMTEVDTSQAWLRQAAQDDVDDPSGTITPAPANGFTYLLTAASYAGGAPVDPVAARTAAERLLAVEDPTATLTEEVDCVSCHLATQARLFAQRHGVDFAALPQFQPPAGYDTTLAVAAAMDGNLSATLAFGWHHRGRAEDVFPSISQRVVNESALVAAFLNE